MKDIVNISKGKTEGEDKKNRRINKRKMILAISIGIIILIIGITMLIYYSSRDARKFLDQYLFRKNITQEKLDTIELDYNSNISIFAYNRYICVLAENKLMEYNSSGKLEHEISLEINNPVYSVNNKYVAISEKGGSKINLISDSNLLWSKDVDGNISKINVNENGYVSIIVTGTTHKSVIIVFDEKGNELFKNYLSSTMAVDTTISKDNKYMAFAEVNTTGTTIQSNIKIVSIDKAKEGKSDYLEYTYTADSNKLIVNIEHGKDNKIICMYNDEISVIQNQSSSTVMSLNEQGKNINFANINLENGIYRAIEENDGIFNTNTILEMKNLDSDKTVVCTVEGAAKYIYSYNNIVAVSLGQEIEFINFTNGWLLKSYSSTQEVQNVVIGNGIAGIIYNDRVEIIKL